MTTDQIEQSLQRLEKALANAQARHAVALETLAGLGYESVEAASQFIVTERDGVVAEKSRLAEDLKKFSTEYEDLL